MVLERAIVQERLSVFPQFAAEILSWLDSLDTG
jgi:hypothetical protein